MLRIINIQGIRKGFMDKERVFEILEIEETKDEDVLKKAYRTKLVKTNPEDDPEGFVRLREAYEEALRLAKEDDAKEAPKDEIDLWVDKARKIYWNIEDRIDATKWEEILSDDICIGLDTEAVARERLLVMFMECCNVPHSIWEIIDNHFHYLDDYNNLIEIFPRNYIDFIVNQIKYEDFIDYELFYGDGGKDVDNLVNLIFKIKEKLDEIEAKDEDANELESDYAEFEAMLDEAYSLKASHPFVDTLHMIELMLHKKLDEANEIMQDLKDGFGELTNKDYMDNPYIKYSVTRVMRCVGYEEEAFELRNQLLENMPMHRGALLDNIDYYCKIGNFKEAKEKSIDFLDKFGNYPAALEYMRLANEKIMQDYKEKADAGDMDSLYDLGWCYFQNEMFEDCINLIESKIPERDSEYEFEYMNLSGRCLAAMGRFEEALTKLTRWKEILFNLTDDGSEKYQKRIKRKGYSNYIIGMCKFNIWDKDKSRQDMLDDAIESLREATQIEKDQKERLYCSDRMAMIYNVSKQYKKTIDVCNEILEKIPQYYSAYVFRQEAYYYLDYPKESMDDYYEAIKYYDKDSRTYELALMLLLDYKQLDEAKSVLETAKQAGVSSDQISFLEIKLRWKCARNEEDNNAILNQCLKELSDMEERFIDNKEENDMDDVADITYVMGLINLELGKRSLGFKYMQKTTEINPEKDRQVYWVLANVYDSENDYRKELKILKKLKKIEPDNMDIRFRIGKCYWCMDENDKARRQFEKVYKQMPQHYLINTYLNDYYLFMYKETLDKTMWEKAMFHAQKQYEINTSDYYLVKIGQLYWEIYDIDKAYDIFVKIKENDENIIDADYYLAKIAMTEWDYKKAHSLLKAAMKKNTETIFINDHLIYKAMIDVCIALGKFSEATDVAKICSLKFQAKTWEIEQQKRILDRSGAKEARLKLLKRLRVEKMAENAPDYVIGKISVDIAKQYYEMDKNNQGAKEIKRALTEVQGNVLASEYVYGEIVEIYEEITMQYKNAFKYALKIYEICESSDKPRRCLKLAVLAGKNGQKKKATQYFKIYNELVQKYYNEPKDYYNEEPGMRARLFTLGEYYYYVGDMENLAKCIDKMDKTRPCSFCNHCKCFELFMLKGYLNLLKGKNDKALSYFEKANVVNNYGAFTDKIVKNLINNKG